MSLEDLAMAESILGTALPISYRSFCLSVGPGDIDDWFQIAAPGYRGQFSARYNLVDHHHAFKFGKWGDAEDLLEDPSVFSSLISFASDEATVDYCWAINQLTEPSPMEYKVVSLDRGGLLVSIADSFTDFIEKCCLGSTSNRLYPDRDVDKTFVPAH